MTRRLCLLLLTLVTGPLLPSCSSTSSTGIIVDNSPVVQARNQAILAEPRGDYYIGRRYFVAKTRFWGYIRRPGQLWENAQLVVMDENRVKTPDRLTEDAGAPQSHGYDHNYEYRIRGRFLGGTSIYDPNADMELPAFQPVSYELVSPRPGFLFSPRDRYDPRYIPAREVPRTTPRRM
ncbi:MAG: hypothetical protein V4726_08335 [Verrucomicrobiota bacterium]